MMIKHYVCFIMYYVCTLYTCDVAMHGIWENSWHYTNTNPTYQHSNHIPKWRRAFTWRKSATTSILIKHSNVRIETVAWLPTADTATASECGSIILPSFPWDPASLGSSATLAIPLIELQTNSMTRVRVGQATKGFLPQEEYAEAI